jgi:hemerythrin-like metal-binding protein/PAS domain S-box-containing protein
MSIFSWNNHFVTGLPEVDAHHRHLVDLTNQVGDLLERPEAAGQSELEAAFDELVSYAGYHFATEQALMTQAGLDPRHVQPHNAEHTSFVQDVIRMRSGLRSSDPQGARDLCRFLANWLVCHILGTDQAMARQIVAVREGKGPADAFEGPGKAVDGLTDTLLGALHDLYGVLAERNRQLADLNQSLESQVADRTRDLAKANQGLVQVVERLRATEEQVRANAARYHAAVESSQDGFWVLDTQGRFLEVNESYCRLSGYTREELLAMRIQDVEASEQPDETATHIQKVMAHGSDLFETVHRTKDGRRWPVEILVTFWPLEGNRMFVFLRDISQRKEAELAVRNSEARFRSLFYDAPVGHALNRLSDGWFLAVNETFATITGHTIDELNALSYWDLTPREYAAQEALQLESLKTTGSYGPYEKEYIHKDGLRIPVVLNGSLVTDPDGTALILSVVSDITGRKRGEKEREDLIRGLQQALEEVKTLGGLLPICSSCKKIRDDHGYWNQLEAYISEHTEAEFSHGICPECAGRYFPGMGGRGGQ